MENQVDRQTDGQTDRYMDRKIDGWRERGSEEDGQKQHDRQTGN